VIHQKFQFVNEIVKNRKKGEKMKKLLFLTCITALITLNAYNEADFQNAKSYNPSTKTPSLEGVDLKGANLSHADLTGANLEEDIFNLVAISIIVKPSVFFFRRDVTSCFFVFTMLSFFYIMH